MKPPWEMDTVTLRKYLIRKTEVGPYERSVSFIDACDVFNRWLEDKFKDAKVIYGNEVAGWRPSLRDPGPLYSHQAILIDIKPIDNSCEHTDKYSVIDMIGERQDCYYKCQDCGAKLKPTAWKEIK